MKFEQALEAMREGQEITREEFEEDKTLMMFESVNASRKIIQVIRRGADFRTWYPSQTDILAEDFQTVDRDDE